MQQTGHSITMCSLKNCCLLLNKLKIYTKKKNGQNWYVSLSRLLDIQLVCKTNCVSLYQQPIRRQSLKKTLSLRAQNPAARGESKPSRLLASCFCAAIYEFAHIAEAHRGQAVDWVLHPVGLRVRLGSLGLVTSTFYLLSCHTIPLFPLNYLICLLC